MTLGKAVAGLNAQSKDRRLGIYGEKTEEEKEKKRKKEKPVELEFVGILGRDILAVRTPDGLRAASDGEFIHAESIDQFCELLGRNSTPSITFGAREASPHRATAPSCYQGINVVQE